MVRRPKIGGAVATGQTLHVNRGGCSACGRHLPRSAFSKLELSRNGAGRCRDCAARIICPGCTMWLLPALFEGKSQCRRCRDNEQVDRLLQTPKDEVTHFGAWRVLRLQREAEYALLLACHRHGLWERLVLQRIMEYLRVPFITSQGFMHYCELCDEAFPDIAVKQGQQLRMKELSTSSDWDGCPGLALAFRPGEAYTVVELHKATNGKWFFRTHAVPSPGKALNSRQRAVASVCPGTSSKLAMQDSSMSNMTCKSNVAAELAVAMQDDKEESESLLAGSKAPHVEHSRPESSSHDSSASFTRESRWAPLSATLEGKQTALLPEHLSSSTHREYEESIALGRSMLVSRAAIELAGKLGERPTTSLSRFRVGLGITGRFCDPMDPERARCLERVRDCYIPVKLLQEVFPGRKDFLWLTPEEMMVAEEKYQQRRGPSRKSL